jgi:hypothetical protein
MGFWIPWHRESRNSTLRSYASFLTDTKFEQSDKQEATGVGANENLREVSSSAFWHEMADCDGNDLKIGKEDFGSTGIRVMYSV